MIKMTWYINTPNNYSDNWDIIESFDTKEETIEYGVYEYKAHLDGALTELFDDDYNKTSIFEIGEGKPFVPYVDSDLIIEQVAEQASWQCGEIGDEWLNWNDITKEQRKELQDNMQKTFDEWLRKHSLEPTFFNVIHIEEIDAKDYL